jgi:hypothetical protein
MHKAAVSDRSKQERKRKIEAQNARTQTAVRDRDRMPRSKRDVIKYPAILTQRDFAFGAAVEVVEYRFWHPLPGYGAEVFNTNNTGRRYSVRGSRHVNSI